jgi:hypothetical protein
MPDDDHLRVQPGRQHARPIPGQRSGWQAALLDGVVGWIDRHLSTFRPGQPAGPGQPDPIADLALLTVSAVRWTDAVPRRSTTGWLDVLEAVHHHPAHRRRSYREPGALVPYLLVAAALVHGGRIGPDDHPPALHRLVRATAGQAALLPAHRVMRLRHALDLAGVGHTLPPYRALHRVGAPYRLVNPVFLTDREIRWVTDVVACLTDLGHGPAAGADDAELGRLAALVERLLGMCVADGDWALTAGLLLAQWSLQRPGHHVEPAWRCLASAQRPDGSLPAHSAATDGDRHTTLVTALAALHGGRRRQE